MGARGPAKVYPHRVTVRLDDESHEFLQAMADITGSTCAEVARVAIGQAIKALDDTTRTALRETFAEFGADEKGKLK